MASLMSMAKGKPADEENEPNEAPGEVEPGAEGSPADESEDANEATEAPGRGARNAGKGGAGGFKAPDVISALPEEIKDNVQRIVAAGMKLMYAPQMKQQVMQAVQSQDPTSKAIADNVAGLVITLDQKAQASGGLPMDAIIPAGVALCGEAAEVMSAAGRDVSQDDYNEAARQVFVILAKKMGANDEQIMQGAASGLKGGAQGGQPQQEMSDASAA